MPRNIFGRRRKWLFGLALGITFVLLVLNSFPRIVEHFILPTLLDRAGLSQYQVAVSRFNTGGASFHISAKSADALIHAGTLRAGWTVPGLLQRRLDRVVFDGLVVNLPLGERSEKDTSPPGISSGPPGIPVTVKEIKIVNSVIMLRDKDRVTSLPLSFSAQLLNPEKETEVEIFRYRIRLDAGEYEVTSDCTYAPGQGRLFGQLQAEIPLASLSEKLSHLSLPLTKFDGRAVLSGVYAVRLVPFLVERVEAQVLFNNLYISGGDMTLQPAGDQTAAIAVSGGNGNFLIQGTGFAVTEPLMATLNLDARVAVAGGVVSWQGDFAMRTPAGEQLGDRFVLAEEVFFQLHHEGEIRGGRTEVQVTGGLGREEKSNSRQLVVRDGERVVRMDSFTVAGSLVYQPRSAPSLDIDFTLNGKELEIDSRGLKLTIPELVFQAAGNIPSSFESGDSEVTGTLTLKNGSLNLQKQGVALQGIQLALPYEWPAGQESAAGVFRVENISLRGNRLGSFSGSVRQVEQKVSLQGELQTVLMPDSAIALDAALLFGQEQGVLAEAAFGVKNSRVDIKNIAVLYPELSSVTGSANLDIQGRVNFTACGLGGELSVQLYKGNFRIPEADFELQDVELGLHVPRLRSFETDPAQKLSIGMIRSNNIVVHDMRASFRVESPDSLFIERTAGKWSGGRIFTSGFRLRKGKQELELALFCDRLELAEILSQFGLAEAEGEGRMSGRIPLVYKDGEFFVDDGFLFTSPGKKGNLKIRKSKYLAVGMPADAVQFSPLHFAGAALTDFEYDWAKLNILSEGGDLLLKLQIDGKPGERLPYRFDPSSNVFVRLEEGASGGLDQPVKLDVNFRVPVNDLFRYQSQLMPLLRNFK